jgi:hypothetical protein
MRGLLKMNGRHSIFCLGLFGQWAYGTDYSAGTGARQVLAVHMGGVAEPDEAVWVGPITATPPELKALGEWAEAVVVKLGGYVHLFPCERKRAGS